MSSSSNSSSRERLRAVFVDAGQQLMLLARRVHTASQERVLGAASHFAQHADATLDTSFQVCLSPCGWVFVCLWTCVHVCVCVCLSVWCVCVFVVSMRSRFCVYVCAGMPTQYLCAHTSE